jgi:hypothetical protein
MTQISHDAGQLRKPDGVWQVTDAESVLFVPNEGTSLVSVVPPDDNQGLFRYSRAADMEAYAKPSLKKYKPMAARNEDRKVLRGLL